MSLLECGIRVARCSATGRAPKDERGVGYVKRNAIAGHRFDSFDDLLGHLDQWMRNVADVRIHGTTGEPPIDRFDREERTALRPLAGKSPFWADFLDESLRSSSI
jgi:hypothetical protein